MKKILFCLFSLFCILAYQPLIVVAGSAFSSSLKESGSNAGYDSKVNGEVVINNTIAKLIQTVLSFLGVLFLVLMIYGGFLWMTAQGNDTQVEKAQSTIRNAVIGLIIVISAYGISILVMNSVGGLSK